MKLALALAVLALGACARPGKPVVRTAVILGNKTTPSVCECPEASAANARAERWKAYAEKLETQLGIPHEDEDKQ